MNQYEKLRADSRKAFAHGSCVQQAWWFKRRQSMFCGLNPTRSTDRLREAFISLGKSGQNGANAGVKFLMCWLLAAIKTNLRRTLLYQLPPFKFRDHLRDCFGWATEPQQPRFDKFVEAVMVELENTFPYFKLR